MGSQTWSYVSHMGALWIRTKRISGGSIHVFKILMIASSEWPVSNDKIQITINVFGRIRFLHSGRNSRFKNQELYSVCVCVCLYVLYACALCVRLCMLVCVCLCVCLCAFVCVCMYLCVRLCVPVCVLVYLCVSVWLCVSVRLCVRLCVCVLV